MHPRTCGVKNSVGQFLYHSWQGTCGVPAPLLTGHLQGTCTTADRAPAGYLHHSRQLLPHEDTKKKNGVYLASLFIWHRCLFGIAVFYGHHRVKECLGMCLFNSDCVRTCLLRLERSSQPLKVLCSRQLVHRIFLCSPSRKFVRLRAGEGKGEEEEWHPKVPWEHWLSCSHFPTHRHWLK